MFGSPETTSGGRDLKFYASLRLDIRRIGAIKDGQEFLGNRIRVKVVKNKCAPPFRQAEFDILYDLGISHSSLLIDLGVDKGVVSRSGSWFSFGDLRLGQGKDNSRKFLEENEDIAGEIEAKVRIALGLDQPDEKSAAEDGKGAASSGKGPRANARKARSTSPRRSPAGKVGGARVVA